MNVNRRKFIKSSLLLGGVSLAGSVLSKNKLTIPQKINHSINKSVDATYKNTKHNRQFYASTRF